MAARLSQHKRKPPARMRDDALLYQPFAVHFEANVVFSTTDAWAAKRKEKQLIALHDAQGPKGYNTLMSTPGWCARFWGMHHGNKQAQRKKQQAAGQQQAMAGLQAMHGVGKQGGGHTVIVLDCSDDDDPIEID
jgi:hypothetical protein